MMSHVTSVSEMDKFFERVFYGFLANMPIQRPCESYILARMNGYVGYPKCENPATIGDVETEFDFCQSCYHKFLRGTFEPLQG
jgi:hypothetical protein